MTKKEATAMLNATDTRILHNIFSNLFFSEKTKEERIIEIVEKLFEDDGCCSLDAPERIENLKEGHDKAIIEVFYGDKK
jgi:hypothetical protein